MYKWYVNTYNSTHDQWTHISGSLIDLACVKKNLIEGFSTNVSVENIYFSNHDVLKIVIKTNAVDFT